MIHAAIYPRKSQRDDNSASMEVQVAMCIEFLEKKYGKDNFIYTLYDKDYGITGHSTKKRKDFQRMMADVRNKIINLVVIQRYDRISRNMYDFCILYHDMETAGCELVSVSQQIDTTTPYGKNYMYMQASNAELEWALNSERRKDINRYARSIGKVTFGKVTFGFKTDKIGGIRRLIIDKEKEPIVRDLFNYYWTYYNACATARYINEKYGTSFSNKIIGDMVVNRFFIGEYKENLFFCEPYFSKEEWERNSKKKPVIRQDYTKKHDSIFTGIVVCPECGRMLASKRVHTDYDPNYRTIFCAAHRTSKICKFNKCKSENVFEKMLMDKLSSMYELDDVTKTIVLEKNVEIKKQTADKYKAELDRLNTMFQKGRIDEKYYDREYVRLTDLIAEFGANTQAQDHSEELRKVFTGNWREIYENLDTLHKKLFWRKIVNRIIIDKNFNILDVQ